MKITKELRELPVEELKTRGKEFQKELFKFKVQAARGGSIADAGKLRRTKKDLARILTLLGEKQRPKNKEKNKEQSIQKKDIPEKKKRGKLE